MRTSGKCITNLAILLIFSSLILAGQACNPVSRMQRQEDRRVSANKSGVEKTKDDREKEYRKKVERQKKIQTKETRKRMKALEKKSKRWRDDKKEPFYERWYSNWLEKRSQRQQDKRE